MTKNPVTVEPGETLASADARMKAGGFRRLPVVREGKLIGILSEYDLRPYLDSLDSTMVGGAMTPDPVTVFAFVNARTCRSIAQGKRDWRPARS